MPSWSEIWARRQLDRSAGPATLLARLMAADGLDTGFGSVSEAAWRDFVLACSRKLAMQPGESIYEVGCGAGAFLLPLAEAGYQVGGVDSSAALIGYAREFLPRGDWRVSEAAQPLPPADVVAACGVFLYFADFAYAGRVLAAMTRSARRGLMVLDVPDAARREATEAARRGQMGATAYAEKYRGLEHRYYEREWFAGELARLGWDRCQIEDQAIDGYANAAGRFNVFAWRSAPFPQP